MAKKKKQKDQNASAKWRHTPFANLKLPTAPTAPKKTTPPEPEPEPKREQGQREALKDNTSFAQMMSDAIPMEEANRIPPKQKAVNRVDHSQTIADDDNLALDEFHALLSPERSRSFELNQIGEAGWEGKAKGVNNQLLAQLRRGEIPPRKELDLHGLLKKEAHQLLKAFIVQSRRDGEQCVLIITGKGLHSLGGQSVLKEAVPDWLSKNPINTHLLAFCPAKPRDGGDGAIYVLLRKFSKS